MISRSVAFLLKMLAGFVSFFAELCQRLLIGPFVDGFFALYSAALALDQRSGIPDFEAFVKAMNAEIERIITWVFPVLEHHRRQQNYRPGKSREYESPPPPDWNGSFQMTHK